MKIGWLILTAAALLMLTIRTGQVIRRADAKILQDTRTADALVRIADAAENPPQRTVLSQDSDVVLRNVHFIGCTMDMK